MSGRIYFAHPINSYNTRFEAATEELIAHVLLDGEISGVENPNHPHHQAGYEKYAKRVKQSDKNHKGMNYFYDEVLPSCDGCVAMPFLDGKLSLGVAGEAARVDDEGKPIWLMRPKTVFTHEDLGLFFSDDPLRSSLFTISEFTDAEKNLLRVDKNMGSSLVLSHEETRLRTWYIYGKKMRPYVSAHLAELSIPEGFYPEQ